MAAEQMANKSLPPGVAAGPGRPGEGRSASLQVADTIELATWGNRRSQCFHPFPSPACVVFPAGMGGPMIPPQRLPGGPGQQVGSAFPRPPMGFGGPPGMPPPPGGAGPYGPMMSGGMPPPPGGMSMGGPPGYPGMPPPPGAPGGYPGMPPQPGYPGGGFPGGMPMPPQMPMPPGMAPPAGFQPPQPPPGGYFGGR